MNFNPELNALLNSDLSELIKTMMNYVDSIDKNYLEKNNNNLMRYWQSKGVSLKSVLKTDLLDWLCCLAFSDGFIAPEEVEFINNYLNQNFSINDIIDLCKFRINQDYFNHLPLSFILLHENNLVLKSIGLNEDSNPLDTLYELFLVIGVHFIYCDGDVYLKELSMLNEYTEGLSKRINDFDLIQNQLAVLEMSGGEFGEEYSESRYRDILKDCTELNESNNLEILNDEIQNSESSSEINFTPWKIEPTGNKTNLWESREIETNYSVNLERNINSYYDFNGEFDNHLANIDDIITDENRQRIENTHLTPQQYRSILNKIKSTSDSLLYKIFNENYIDFESLTLFEKILLFTNSFVDADYKSSGEELGLYSFNRIHLDDRTYSSYQIITLIHELSHHLLSEIFEQVVMILLNTDKTDAVELYVDLSLHSSNCFVLLNEYCAHTVEGHFTPKQYHDYGSFIKVLEEFDLNNENDKQIVLKSMILGNTFSQDILEIIKPFIDNNLSKEIKQEFKKDFDGSYNPEEFSFEIEATFEIDVLLDYINFILVSGMDKALNNSES